MKPANPDTPPGPGPIPNFVVQAGTVDRKDQRFRVSREASIVFGGGRVNCRILNSSAGGALLELPYTEWLPPRFELEDAGVRRQVALVCGKAPSTPACASSTSLPAIARPPSGAGDVHPAALRDFRNWHSFPGVRPSGSGA